MAATPQSRLSLNSAYADLGLGGQLKQQLSEQEEERRKKMLGSRGTMGGSAAADLGLGSTGY